MLVDEVAGDRRSLPCRIILRGAAQGGATSAVSALAMGLRVCSNSQRIGACPSGWRVLVNADDSSSGYC